MHSCSFPLRRNHGFSLVEIMVGIAIGLLGVLIIMQVSVVFEGQKRTTTTGSDAQTNGVSALYAIERDVRKAGYGFSVPGVLGCTVKRYYNADLDDLTLAPVTITNGANGAPDSIRILASSKGNWSLPSRVTVDHPAEATSIFLNTNLGMAKNDFLIMYEPLKTCTLMQVTEVTMGSDVQVIHQNNPWNPVGGSIFPAGGYGVGALVLNMGTFIDHTYSLKDGNLMLSEFDSSNNTSTARAVTADIVNVQAEYGFDKRAGVQTSPIVSDDGWSATMIDADDNGITGDAGDIERMVAVRMAVVARSPLMEKPNANGVCDITTTSPTWTGGSIDVSKNPDGSDNANWKCYRYKTFENVIPLRNLLWGRT